jgi:2'-5' RNA ligase
MKKLEEIPDFNEFVKSINEKIDTQYEYGCIMAYTKDIKQININDADIYDNDNNEFGIETEQHVTVLYGLHDNEILEEDVINLFNMITLDSIKLTGISLFNNELYDVVKYDVESESLHILNKMATCMFPFTSNFPDYHPHMTIDYCKPGKGEKYIKTFKKPKEVKFEYWVYSMANGKKIKIVPGKGVKILREAVNGTKT